MSRIIRLLTDDFSSEPALDTAISRALLLGVSEGTEPETLRIHRPGNVVAFGRQDAVSPGYAKAVMDSRRLGFTPIERLAGGRAAIFHSGTIAFAWSIPEDSPKEGITERFRLLGEIMVTALQSLGVAAAIGEVAGEYCPGTYSVNARGVRKLVGTGQRLARRAAHVGGVVVVDGRDRVNTILDPVYWALDLDWDPEATGDVVSERPGTSWDAVRDAILAAFADRFRLEHGEVPERVVERARALALEHLAKPSGLNRPGR